jgi:hypothetical protein
MRAALLALLIAAASQPAGPTKVTLKGVVVDDDDRPVAKATVSASAVQGSGANTFLPRIRDEVSDEKGQFTLTFHLVGDRATCAVRVRVGDGRAFLAKPAEVRGADLDKPLRLKISPKHARSLSVRVKNEDGKPVAGAAVAARYQAAAPPAPFPAPAAEPVKWPEKAATDDEGCFTSPRCVAPYGKYQLVLTAEGYLEETVALKEMGADVALAFGDVVLRRQRPLEGEVVDKKGKPVAGAKVAHATDRQRVTAATDAAGRFKLTAAFSPPGFLFIEKDGFRFHGQRCDRPDKVRIALTRRDEPAAKRMAALPPALPLAKRKALAAKLMEPTFQRVLPKGSDTDRMRLLTTLAQIDPGRALEELDKRPMKHPRSDGYVRRAVVKALAGGDHEEARTVADSIKDPGFRAHCYIDLHDALPADKKADRLTCLNRALVAARAIEGNDHKLYHLAQVARRLHAIGEKDRAAKLLREGQAIAKELPTAGFAGYARGAFAEDLALIDLPAALGLMKDLKDPFEYIRHHGNLAQKLAATDIDEAERVLELIARRPAQGNYNRDHYALRVCYRLAGADPKRAAHLAGSIKDETCRVRVRAALAQVLAKRDPRRALEQLDEAYAGLAQQAAAKAKRSTYSDAASLAGLLLPVAERIDPALVPEFYWRALSFRATRDAKEPDDRTGAHAAATGALALTLARYDRGLALALLDAAKAPGEGAAAQGENLFLAAALADPARAAAMLAKLPAGRDGDWTREQVVKALLAEGEEVSRVVHRTLAQWYLDDEDV